MRRLWTARVTAAVVPIGGAIRIARGGTQVSRISIPTVYFFPSSSLRTRLALHRTIFRVRWG